VPRSVPLERVQGLEDPSTGPMLAFKTTTELLQDHLQVHPAVAWDASLISHLQMGCEPCFDALFSRYSKFAFKIAWRILRQRSDAEDTVQEVFLTVYVQCAKYDAHRGSVKTWIAQLANFKAMMRRRGLQRKLSRNIDESVNHEACAVQESAFLERSALVDQCLATLNSRQRRTVELIHFDGCTLLETAAALNQSLANTRNLYYRGIQALRAQFSSSRMLSGKLGMN
jgi:RNA polymerase sigma-70 factor (ECF subfamily)